jgi:formylglycine-generating enzyme required for sulfatase activity
MWVATNEYLELNPQHENLRRMRQQLEARIQKSLAHYADFRELKNFWATQSVSVLSQLSSSVLSQLPASVLSQLPASVLGQIPASNWPESKNSIGMAFKLLPGGVFTMGDGNDAHEVTLTQPFELGVYEVTQDQYQKVMGTNPSKFKGLRNPVEQVSWGEAVKFCRKLSALPAEKAAGYVYRLRSGNTRAVRGRGRSTVSVTMNPSLATTRGTPQTAEEPRIP